MIRQAQEKDFGAIVQLWQEANLALNASMPQYYNNHLSSVQTFVFIDRHQIKGFISLAKNNRIDACYVKQIFQRRKIGEKLIRYIQRRYPNLQSDVYAKNNQAIDFYHKHGFKVIKEEYLPEKQEIQLLMCWSLGCPVNRFSRQKGDS